MFTIYSQTTKEKVANISSYDRAEAICDSTKTLIFDDTCPHDTAYAICKECE